MILIIILDVVQFYEKVLKTNEMDPRVQWCV